MNKHFIISIIFIFILIKKNPVRQSATFPPDRTSSKLSVVRNLGLECQAGQLNPNHLNIGNEKSGGYTGTGTKADGNQLNPNNNEYKTV